MSPSLPPVTRNRLLRTLSSHDLSLLQPFLEPVTLDFKAVLADPAQPIEYVYFVEQGIVSVVAVSRTNVQQIEISIVGREGMVGVPVILAMDRMPHLTFVQVAGSALRMRAEHLRHAMDASSSLRKLLLRYVHTVCIQTAHTALSNGRFTINQRLARWILMSHDRLDGDDVPLTHELLALMLGVRRAGVTVALHVLEGEHMIKSTRAHVRVRDRAKLEDMAADIYGVPEAEYRRVIGPYLRDASEDRPNDIIRDLPKGVALKGAALNGAWFVAIGASGSGGLDDVRQLLSGLPPDLGAVVLVVLHRPVDQISHLRDVLSRASGIPVVIAEDGERFEPGTCYIGSPAQHLTLAARSLGKLVDGSDNQYRNRTIDLLFNSVARHGREHTIGIVLSGGLDDGARGLAEIKRMGGLSMVLTPGVWPERGMPENAIGYDGPIDLTGSPDQIAAAIREAVGPQNHLPGTKTFPEQPVRSPTA